MAKLVNSLVSIAVLISREATCSAVYCIAIILVLVNLIYGIIVSLCFGVSLVPALHMSYRAALRLFWNPLVSICMFSELWHCPSISGRSFSPHPLQTFEPWVTAKVCRG